MPALGQRDRGGNPPPPEPRRSTAALPQSHYGLPIARRYCPRCHALHGPGRCPASVARYQQATDAQRGSAAERGYDADWRRARAHHLASHPFCVDCISDGRPEIAAEVHHVVRLRSGGERLDQANLMSLCARHHAIRTRRGE
jgi:5-methylcytosine-specific restriction protein A